MTFPDRWPIKRARYIFALKDVRGFSAPLASATKDGVVLRDDLDFSVWNPGSDVSNYKLVEKDNFVIGLRSFQHGISHSAVRGIVSPAYTVLSANSEVEPRFFKHYFRSSLLISNLANLTQGIRQGQAINIEAFRDLLVPLPPLEEQRRIADFLDAEAAKLSTIVDRSRALTALLFERRSALLRDCFTFPADDRVNVIPLRRVIARWIDYRGATPEKTASGIPLVTAKNIRDGEIDLDASQEYISEDAYVDWMRRGLLEAGDILLTTEAPLGQVAILADPSVALAQRIIVLRADRDACPPQWLYWYLRSPQGQSELELRATGSTALGIKADRLRGVPIPLPGLGEASQRVAQLARQVSQIGEIQQRLAVQRRLLAERRQALITAAVTGQFDVSSASGRGVTEGVTA